MCCYLAALAYRQVDMVILQGIPDSGGCLFISRDKGQPGIADRETDMVKGILGWNRVGDNKKGIDQRQQTEVDISRNTGLTNHKAIDHFLNLVANQVGGNADNAIAAQG